MTVVVGCAGAPAAEELVAKWVCVVAGSAFVDCSEERDGPLCIDAGSSE